MKTTKKLKYCALGDSITFGFITDGTHPTPEGSELMANALAAFIKQLL